MWKGGERMNTRELKKFLAGFGIASLIAGAGLIIDGNLNVAQAG